MREPEATTSFGILATPTSAISFAGTLLTSCLSVSWSVGPGAELCGSDRKRVTFSVPALANGL